jgi:hypothetical protein
MDCGIVLFGLVCELTEKLLVACGPTQGASLIIIGMKLYASHTNILLLLRFATMILTTSPECGKCTVNGWLVHNGTAMTIMTILTE